MAYWNNLKKRVPSSSPPDPGVARGTGESFADGPATLRRDRIAFAALHHRDFRMYFIASMLAMMADNIEHVISYWVLFQKFHSPILGGFAVISHWTPFLLFSFHAGALADRFDCRGIIQVGQVMFVVVSLAWGIFFLTDTIQLWHAAFLLIVHGLAGVLWEPPALLILHDMVGSEHLESAVRLNAMSRYLGMVLGPVVGGVLLLVLGPPSGLFVNALIYLPMILWSLIVPYTGHTWDAEHQRKPVGMKLRDALEALREVSGNRVIFSMVLLSGAGAFFIGTAFQAHMPEYAHDLSTGDEGFAYSALLTANAAGAVIGGLLLEMGEVLQLRARTAIVCAILFSIAMGWFGLTTNYPLALALLLVAGIFNLAFVTMAQTLVQLLAPVRLRGRLIGVFATANLGLRAFSGVTVGVLGAWIGIHWSLALSAVALLVVTVALLAYTVSGRPD